MGGMRVVLVVLVVAMVARMVGMVEGFKGKPPAYFTLGDSLVDVGNNNYFFTLAEAHHKPYGLDRQDQLATGRFCNGKIIPDLINDYLGTPYSLPVLAPEANGTNLLRGINYASAGAGILEETGAIFLGRLTMSQQFNLFRKTKEQMAKVIGQSAMEELIDNALVLVSVGGNDYVNNYESPATNTKNKYTPTQFQSLLMTTFKGQLEMAYGLGMRKFIISNMATLGCAPSILSSKSKNGECVAEVNKYAMDFNTELKGMLENLMKELPNSYFLYANTYGAFKEIIDQPLKYGFTDPVPVACCGVGKFNGIDGACRTPITNLCSNRSKSIFWDAFHPTAKVNDLVARRFLDGGLDIISPLNVRALLKIMGFEGAF